MGVTEISLDIIVSFRHLFFVPDFQRIDILTFLLISAVEPVAL